MSYILNSFPNLQISERLLRIREGDPLYFHPKSTNDLASFGLFQGIEGFEDNSGEYSTKDYTIYMNCLIDFEFDHKHGLWFPQKEDYDGCFPFKDIARREIDFSYDLKNIQKMMEDAENYNFNLVKALYEKL